MFVDNVRPAASRLTRTLRSACAVAVFATLSLTLPAHAVVVHGTVTDAFGRAVSLARVQLVQGPNVVAFTMSGADGSYEIRSTQPGRFTLLTSAATYTPGIGTNFYGGTTDDVVQNIVLETATYREVVTVTATGLPTPVEQTSSPVTLVQDRELATRIGLVDELRQSPGVAVVQTGQTGGITSLFIRGGNSDANKVLVDGITAEDVGGRFDFGTVSSTAIGGGSPTTTAVELYRGPDSVLYGSDASAGVVALTTPRGSGTRPVLNYSGSAGNFHTYRNEATVSGAHQKLDYLAAFSRLNTSNALPLDEYHSATSAINLGYTLPAGTLARFTLRNAVSASGLPGAHDFYGISAAGKESDQDLYSGLTVESRLAGNWHNLVRYGIARKREQASTFYPVGQAVKGAYGTTYYGNKVAIRGANGYTATGQAAINYSGTYPQTYFAVSNRDELYYQSDYIFPKRIVGLFGFRYENERGSFLYPVYSETERLQRTNFEYTAQFQGDILHRVFYSAGGAVEKNHEFGIAGTPRLGLAYVPVHTSGRIFRGTRLRANIATGVQEPSLAVDFSSLYTQLAVAGNAAAIKQYGITPIRQLRSRTFDAGIDQNILGEKLIVKLGYFHNQFSHQIEYVGSGTLKKYFGLTGAIPGLYGADLTSLAFRAQGVETEVQWQALSHLFVRGGYTYLNANVEQSFSSAALSVLPGGFASTNPAFPNVPVGSSPFIGGRPFRRPAHTGFFGVQYTAPKFTAAIKGAMASRSDDSTFLDYSDLSGTDSLILPNRDLDFGYVKLDASATYQVRSRVTAFTQLDNLLSQQHIGPIGYPGLPFTVRTGLMVRISGD